LEKSDYEQKEVRDIFELGFSIAFSAVLSGVNWNKTKFFFWIAFLEIMTYLLL